LTYSWSSQLDIWIFYWTLAFLVSGGVHQSHG
jgi:hypothetical protein